MYKVVGIRFKRACKVYYFEADEAYHRGDQVIVETSRGLELGEVVMENRNVGESEVVHPLKKILRKATTEDLQYQEETRELESKAFEKCQDRIKKHQLEMKLVGAEYTFDRSKIIFYFTAEGRVDFRELVKDLASIFKTRIELRQIGVRDEAKIIGGMGPCGRPLCCATFIREFASVSIRMAKSQNLSLNPTKISGVCGRLMCCLKYEMDTYEEVSEEYPDVGDEVITPDGEGQVVSVNVVKNAVQVDLKDSTHIKEFPLEEVDPITNKEE